VNDARLDLETQKAINNGGTSTSEYTGITYKQELNNPYSVNMYVLSYNSKKHLVPTNIATINNIQTYMERYRMLTDGINILSGFVINIGVDFDIIVYKGYNKKEILANCIDRVKQYFDIDSWTFKQPINLSTLQLEIASVEGVQSVNNLKIINLTSKDGDYSENEYNIEAATIDNIIYPSLDPSVFELKFPSKDIRARAL
jgi:hypothetical protein